ncbi:hypothetical protein [Providencia phage Kokobel2]|nr:hypothetical protein [Providencia phage Kokobel2]
MEPWNRTSTNRVTLSLDGFHQWFHHSATHGTDTFLKLAAGPVVVGVGRGGPLAGEKRIDKKTVV